VLDAAEALFFSGADELAVFDESGGGIAVEGVEAENDHFCKNPGTLPPLVNSGHEPTNGNSKSRGMTAFFRKRRVTVP
jgi:hypothetical protein